MFTHHRELNCVIRLLRQSVMGLVVIAVLAGFASQVQAQLLTFAQQGSPPDPGLELLQAEPYDILYFTEKAGGGWAQVQLLDLPGRRLPSNPKGSLKFKLIGYENTDFTVKWKEIDRIDLWEERLESETDQRIARGDFVGAYPFLSVLIRDYPERKGLK
jgi:hypothetical protein